MAEIKTLVQCPWQKYSPRTLVSGDIRFLQIFAGFSGKEASNDSGSFDPNETCSTEARTHGF